MAQNFRRYTSNAVGATPVAVYSPDSYDAIVGISLSNILSTAITVSCYINDGSNNIYLVKDAPIPTGGALQVLDGGAKYVVQNSDVLSVVSSDASSCDVWISAVDAIST
jgi:hypothetical protein|tara:strand:- start:751 stop:1077 length:327 start_codon:yes stop_codon:yes gene_type:complete